MQAADLRVALFSGNYNYVRDGANQALNRLVDYLLRQGANVRVYSPTVENPAFPPTGDLVSVPGMPIPFRREYQLPLGLSAEVRRDLASFAPNVVHVTSPDPTAHRAITWARAHDVPVLVSVHTRFETYLRYYHLGFLEPLGVAFLRRFYSRCDAMVAPSESTAAVMREQGMGADIGIWSRGVDFDIFNPSRRDLAWRRSLGFADDMPVIGFLGRLVMEKGLDVFGETIDLLKQRGVAHKVLVVGEGPARAWFERRLGDAVFVGLQAKEALGRAVASMDLLFNPSDTETFGNVTLEALASGIPVVAARATGSESLVTDGITGRLVPPGDSAGFADALAFYCEDETARVEAGRAGNAFSRRFAWDEVNQRMVESYLRVIGQRAGGCRQRVS